MRKRFCHCPHRNPRELVCIPAAQIWCANIVCILVRIPWGFYDTVDSYSNPFLLTQTRGSSRCEKIPTVRRLGREDRLDLTSSPEIEGFP